MPGGNQRQAVVTLVDDSGVAIQIRETFAVSTVAEPLLALGKLMKKGWAVSGENGEIKLRYGNSFCKTVQLRQNSLVTDACIHQVLSTEIVRAITMKFEEPIATELQVPGWQLMGEKQIPALISAHALKYKSCEPQFDRQQFPFRTTIVLVEGEWHVVEFASTEDTNDEIEELGGKAGHVVTFFSREPNDPKTLGDLFTGSDDPFLSPAVVSQPARNSFAWQGRSLEDGVYDGEEVEEPEMGEQLEVTCSS